MARPGPDPSVEDEEILLAIVSARPPAVGTSDVSDEIGLSSNSALRHLERLEEDGLVKSWKVGTVRIWWPTDDGRALLG